MADIDWEAKYRALEAAVDFVLTEDGNGIPRCSSHARKVLQNAIAGRGDPYVMAVAHIERERHREAVEDEIQRLRARAARPWWVELFPWRITIERRN